MVTSTVCPKGANLLKRDAQIQRPMRHLNTHRIRKQVKEGRPENCTLWLCVRYTCALEFPSRLSGICYSLGDCTFSSHSAGVKLCTCIILETQAEKSQQRGEALEAEQKHNTGLGWPKMLQRPIIYVVQQQQDSTVATFVVVCCLKDQRDDF